MNATEFYSLLGLLLFGVGVTGFLFKRSGVGALMCIELMLNGVNLCLVAFSRAHANPQGSSLVLFVVLVAAAEAAIALSLFVTMFRRIGTISMDDFRGLKG